jgi:hypothetical protein
MTIEQRVHALLGPADPACDSTVEPPRLTAHDLIVRAEAATGPAPGVLRHRMGRRTLVTGAAAAAALGAAGVVAVTRPSGAPAGRHGGTPTGASTGVPALGPVVVPVQYQIPTGAGAAGGPLRALADRLTDVLYERHAGRYTYHRLKVWGDPQMVSPDGRYVLGYTSYLETWRAADGTGRQRTTPLPPEFPDAASRQYWARQGLNGPGSPNTDDLPPFAVKPLPSDPTGLAAMLDTSYGVGAVAKQIGTVYGRYAVPRATRAEILRVLAGVPGFMWRGRTTDQAGRTGVAVTADDPPNHQQHVLIFDPATGALLAHELVNVGQHLLGTYQLFLATDRTGHPS